MRRSKSSFSSGIGLRPPAQGSVRLPQHPDEHSAERPILLAVD
jgi:hypothetical protein